MCVEFAPNRVVLIYPGKELVACMALRSHKELDLNRSHKQEVGQSPVSELESSPSSRDLMSVIGFEAERFGSLGSKVVQRNLGGGIRGGIEAPGYVPVPDELVQSVVGVADRPAGKEFANLSPGK